MDIVRLKTRVQHVVESYGQDGHIRRIEAERLGETISRIIDDEAAQAGSDEETRRSLSVDVGSRPRRRG